LASPRALLQCRQPEFGWKESFLLGGLPELPYDGVLSSMDTDDASLIRLAGMLRLE
jgi:hypothetical protein